MKVKTALGKTLDMGALISKNEKVRAVGNMKVNARGDVIDSHNKIIETVNDKSASGYAKTVGNKSGQIVSKQNDKINKNLQKAVSDPIDIEALEDEQKILEDLQEYANDDLNIIKKTKDENDTEKN